MYNFFELFHPIFIKYANLKFGSTSFEVGLLINNLDLCDALSSHWIDVSMMSTRLSNRMLKNSPPFFLLKLCWLSFPEILNRKKSQMTILQNKFGPICEVCCNKQRFKVYRWFSFNSQLENDEHSWCHIYCANYRMLAKVGG